MSNAVAVADRALYLRINRPAMIRMTLATLHGRARRIILDIRCDHRAWRREELLVGLAAVRDDIHGARNGLRHVEALIAKGRGAMPEGDVDAVLNVCIGDDLVAMGAT